MMPAGRPKTFQSPEELQEKIDAYFLRCDDQQKIPNKAGLSVFLKCSRDTLSEYSKKKEYSDTIKDCYDRIEERWIESLHDNKQASGTIFYLKNAFRYRDKIETDITSGGKPLPILGGITAHITPQKDEEQAE